MWGTVSPCIFLCKVLEMGLEPISLAACDFESHVYTIPPLQHSENEHFPIPMWKILNLFYLYGSVREV